MLPERVFSVVVPRGGSGDRLHFFGEPPHSLPGAASRELFSAPGQRREGIISYLSSCFGTESARSGLPTWLHWIEKIDMAPHQALHLVILPGVTRRGARRLRVQVRSALIPVALHR
jgi:hypothetical protein